MATPESIIGGAVAWDAELQEMERNLQRMIDDLEAMSRRGSVGGATKPGPHSDNTGPVVFLPGSGYGPASGGS